MSIYNDTLATMTSFLKQSAEYSQTESFKHSLLAPLLKTYNEYLLSPNTQMPIKAESYLIPNNNQKFYLLVTVKNSTCNQLYFFKSSSASLQSADPLSDNQLSEFFLEIDKRFNESFLFEGYMYKDNAFSFLATDLLMKNNQVVMLDYPLRYALINEIFIKTSSLKHLNDHLNISIHPIFPSCNELMIAIFRNNFIFKQTINAMETISNNKKTRQLLQAPEEHGGCLKLIERGAYADVYNVKNASTGDKEGILYIKGVVESKYAKQLLKNKETIEHMCSYNTSFNKWQLTK